MADKPGAILEYVLKNLEKHQGSWREISAITKVPYYTIAKINQGVTKDPRIGTVQALLDLFLEVERGARHLSAQPKGGTP